MPKAESIYALLNAARLASKDPQNAGDYFTALAVILGLLYICRRFVFKIVAEKFPKTALIFNKLGVLVGIIIIIGCAAFLLFVVYMFCSNLYGDIAS